jgi:integrase
VLKEDGEKRPRIESWENVARHLWNLLSPRLGKKLACEVTKHDIAELSNDIVAGKHGGKASVSTARHMRRAASGLFNWAAQAGNDFVSTSPCINLPELDKENPRDRVLSEDEVRTLWHGFDREDVPWDRRTRLAIKFALTTMLRSGEMLPIHRDELNAENGTVDIPARRVKKRRVINQPLSDLALASRKRWAITNMPSQGPLRRCVAVAPSDVRRADWHQNEEERQAADAGHLRTARTRAVYTARFAADCGNDVRRDGLSDAGISLCLDHQANKDEKGKPLPAVTRKVYNLATRVRVAKKREVLDAWAIELRPIVSEPEQLAVAA